MRFLIMFLATGAYTGFVPVASGTAGSALGLLMVWAGLGEAAGAHPVAGAMALIATIAAGCLVCGKAESILNEHDSSKITLDEVVGMMVTMFLNPVGWRHLAVGFVLFRIFDVIKPFPAGYLDRNVSGGGGVMLDDVAAALYANLALRALAHLF